MFEEKRSVDTLGKREELRREPNGSEQFPAPAALWEEMQPHEAALPKQTPGTTRLWPMVGLRGRQGNQYLGFRVGNTWAIIRSISVTARGIRSYGDKVRLCELLYSPNG